MRYLKSCISLQITLLIKKIPALLAICLAVLLLGTTAAVAGNVLFSKPGGIHFSIVIATEDDDERIDTAVRVLSGLPAIKDFALITQTTPEQAEQMVRNNKATAAIVLPVGFLGSVFSGENKSPKLFVNAARPLEKALITNLAYSAINLLSSTQQGVYYVQEVFENSGQPQSGMGALIEDINFVYAKWVLQASSLFKNVFLSSTGSLNFSQHYIISLFLFFVALSTPVLFSIFSFSLQSKWLQRLRSAGCPFAIYSLSQILAGFFAFAGMLFILLPCLAFFSGMESSFTLAVVPGLLLTALCLSCLAFLVCNTGTILASVVLNFLLSVSFLFCAGGLIPLAFLPLEITLISPFTPFVWMRNAIAPLFGAPFTAAPLVILLVFSFVLLCACLIYSRHVERRGLQRASF